MVAAECLSSRVERPAAVGKETGAEKELQNATALICAWFRGPKTSCLGSCRCSCCCCCCCCRVCCRRCRRQVSERSSSGPGTPSIVRVPEDCNDETNKEVADAVEESEEDEDVGEQEGEEVDEPPLAPCLVRKATFAGATSAMVLALAQAFADAPFHAIDPPLPPAAIRPGQGRESGVSSASAAPGTGVSLAKFDEACSLLGTETRILPSLLPVMTLALALEETRFH